MIRSVRTLSDNLRAAMLRSGLNASTLAGRLNVPSQQVDKWLKGITNIELVSLFKLAVALNTSIESLVSGVNVDYEAKRQRSATPERVAEVYQLAKDRQPLATYQVWRLLQSLAGLPVDEPSPAPVPAPGSDAPPTAR